MSVTGALPSLSADQMREVDRLMLSEQGIDLVQMMENAGRSLADLAIRRYQPGCVIVLAGSGGNGGGGLAAARHLANRAVQVHTVLADASRMTPVPDRQLRIVSAMQIPIRTEPPADAGDLIIDALIGYSLRGQPRGGAAELIAWANRHPAPVLSLDNPSGLDVTTGAADLVMQADATMTLALPKSGLLGADAVGHLYLADISVPARVYDQLGLSVDSPFQNDQIIELDAHGRPQRAATHPAG